MERIVRGRIIVFLLVGVEESDPSDTFTRTLIANNPNTAPEAPTETAFLGRNNHETRLAPAPVKI